MAELVEQSYIPNLAGAHYCDFCGVELLGTDYSILSDGRERCSLCSRSVIKSEVEFTALYEEVRRNMRAFYGVEINVPIQVKMVNAKRLHKKLGKTFVPSGKFDSRTVGVAIRNRKGYYIYLENGAPRLSSCMTIAHELTHIWQYLNWKQSDIIAKYGKDKVLEIYEGMAKWSEIQYVYLINDRQSPAARR